MIPPATYFVGPLTATGSRQESPVCVSSAPGYVYRIEWRNGTLVLQGAEAPPMRAQLSPEVMRKAERAAKFFARLPSDDNGGKDPDYGLL